MRKFAVINISNVHAWRRPVHRINPTTKRTYCQIENAQMGYVMASSGLRHLQKFDKPPAGNPMCKNCESMFARLAPDECPVLPTGRDAS